MDQHFDVIVIGAGINGAGIARDAAMRGLRVLLIDKGDVASGTSAAATRLIHGGLRYLEHFEFGLVHESLRERETLMRIAPHLVRPLAITIPIYKESRRGRATIRAGMIAYDLLSLGKSLPRHRMLSVAETLKRMPGLKAEGLVGSAVYYDAQVEFAERLVVENVLDAIAHGATVLTYTRVTKLLIADGRVRGVEVEGNKVVLAEVVINAAGPWVDQLIDQRLIGGTRGSHVVVAPFAGAPESAVYLEAVSDGRPFFIIPWNGSYLIGTTDVRVEDAPEEVRAELWEVDYLLAETNRVFPTAMLKRESVLYTYSGVRPLPFSTEKDEQSITRRHFLRQHPRFENVVTVVGGKLTTYRSLAEECVDLVLRRLGHKSSRSETATRPLPGGGNFSDFKNIPVHWPRIYGSRAREVAALAKRLDGVFEAEMVFAFEQEFAKTLADCFLRRTMMGLSADLGLSRIEEAASVGVKLLGWSEERARREVEAYREEISRMKNDGSHHC
ncbi:MAG TPA: glycerol-3-phosphate dehydrogenase/oxidase [Pyrinomonadaceae bacterium]|nr:glycerol-3-phosphate dehydrogenase/oxidase [Pyrinomonadaceae bacterium]